MHATQLLCCPFCRESLEPGDHILFCSRGHTFDIAREGYVNLLRKKQPGDTREMLQARRAFLEAGVYQPFSDMLNALALEQLWKQHGPIHVGDAGCGEGYYPGRLRQVLLQAGREAHEDDCYLGIDISKDAVRMAAKRYPQIDFVVANLKEELIVQTASLHLLLNIFAPRNPSEFARVLQPGGWLLVGIPAPDHLQALRERLQLLQIEEQKQQHVIAQFEEHFSLVQVEPVAYTVRLRGEEITQAVMMTPNYWHLSPAQTQTLQKLSSSELETSIAFICLLFQKK